MPYRDASDPRARASRRKHYAENKDQYLQRNAESRERKSAYLQALKGNTPCADCGIRYPHYVMEFDHLDAEEKLAAPGQLTRNSWKMMLTEVAKCDIVCGNCHNARTYRRRSGA